jgi:putative endonuclease
MKDGYYYVYILLCSDSKYYIGVTNDLERRVAEHQSGDSSSAFTYSRLPVKLVYHEFFNNVNQAIAFEKKIKKWSRRKKEALINQEFDLLPELARKKFD